MKVRSFTMVRSLIVAMIGCGALLPAAGLMAAAKPGQVTVRGTVAIYTAPTHSTQALAVDFVNAQPMELPQIHGSTAATFQEGMVQALLSQPSRAAPRYVPGAEGDGKAKPAFLGRPRSPALMSEAAPRISPQAHGSFNHPFSTARADAYQGATNRQYPYRASGRLFFNTGFGTAVCSASMIRKGIVLTAAHCLAEYGGSFYTNFRFVPGYRNGAAPYGTWSGASAAVLNSYLRGRDNCSTPGVVCANDIGVVRLRPQNGRFAGQSTGFYGYGINGFGFAAGTSHITQLGYPGCLDNGTIMARNDSQGYVHGPSNNNTVIGSLMCGGSSGGPWLVNFGRRPNLTGTNAGSAATPNTVVGVTSWGYTSSNPKEQGASPFTSNNIGVLANSLCGGSPNPC